MKRNLVRAFCAFLISVNAGAEQATLSTVVVNAQRPPAEAENITRFDERDLLRTGFRELNQVFNGYPSVNTPQTMKGGFTVLTLRGAGGGMGLVNIDGIPLHNTVTSALSLDLFPAEIFGSAEIVRGSGAMLSFGRALGGSFNLHSRDANETGAGLHVEGGSFGALRETGSANLAGESHHLSLIANRDDLFDGTHWADPREGNPERDAFHAHEVALHAVSAPAEHVQLDHSLYYVNGNSDSDKVGLLPSGRFGIVDDPNGRLYQEIWLAQSTARVDINPDWQSALQLGYTQHRVSAEIGGAHLGFLDQLSLVRWKNTHSFGRSEKESRLFQLNWGGEGLYEEGTAADGLFTGRRGTGGGFANLRADWNAWSGVVAVRADHFDVYGAQAVYHAGLNWRMTSELEWYLSGGTGYRPPSFNELLMPFFGNLDLQPEKGASGETGLRWRPGETSQISVDYFYNRFDDLIVVTLTPSGLNQAENVPHARIQGLEAQWSTRWSRAITTGIDYTWSRSENLDTGNPLPRSPEHIARFWSEWKFEALPVTLWSQGVYRGPSFDNEGAERISDAFYLNLQLSYQVADPFSLYVRGENLTDNRNPQIPGLAMPGAAVYGGFRVILK